MDPNAELSSIPFPGSTAASVSSPGGSASDHNSQEAWQRAAAALRAVTSDSSATSPAATSLAHSIPPPPPPPGFSPYPWMVPPQYSNSYPSYNPYQAYSYYGWGQNQQQQQQQQPQTQHSLDQHANMHTQEKKPNWQQQSNTTNSRSQSNQPTAWLQSSQQNKQPATSAAGSNTALSLPGSRPQQFNSQQQSNVASGFSAGDKSASNASSGAFNAFKLGGGHLQHLQQSFVAAQSQVQQRFNAYKQQAPEATEETCKSVPQLGALPENVRKYVERSYLATPANCRQKLVAYLEKRIRPLIASGAHKMVRWDTEPLPHTRNYELPVTWTPVKRSLSPATSHSASFGVNAASAANAPLFSRRLNKPAAAREEHRRKRDHSEESSPEEERRRRRQASPQESFFFDRERRTPPRRSSSSDGPVFVKEVKLQQKKKPQKKLTKAEKKKNNQMMKMQAKQGKQFKFQSRPNDCYKKAQRAQRFAGDVSVVPRITTNTHCGRAKIVGTSTEIEKRFFRLTAAPDPSTVRPLQILEKSLDFVKQKYKEGAEYRYLSNQLKSIRQDLTVQQIRNKFTVHVYEVNARVCLENKDREEFNQCQSQLKLLYSEIPDCENEGEFISYRLLYYIAMSNTLDISTLIKNLTPKLRKEENVEFALKVRTKLLMGDQVGFFKLYAKAPKMSPYLIDLFVEKERKIALTAFIKAFRPSLPVSKVADWLGMNQEELMEWLLTLGISVQVEGILDCRQYAALVIA